MKYKSLLIAFILGCVITIVGAVFKLMHWPGASLLLISGMFCEALAGIMLIMNIYKKQNPNGLFKK